MRISDWSSDVCSSDLAGRAPQAGEDHRRCDAQGIRRAAGGLPVHRSRSRIRREGGRGSLADRRRIFVVSFLCFLFPHRDPSLFPSRSVSLPLSPLLLPFSPLFFFPFFFFFFFFFLFFFF